MGCTKYYEVPIVKIVSLVLLLSGIRQAKLFLKEFLQIEECEEEEIIIDSDDEGEENGSAFAGRGVSPTPIQDFAANTVYTEGQ